jgi:ABC-type branched-subunit amino acid transport system ATPase component
MDAGQIIADDLPDVVLSDATVVSAYLGGHAA